MNENKVWNKVYTLEVRSKPKAIWQAFIDTDNWKQWNPGVKSITIEGPFQTGTWFTMTLPEGDIIRSQLTDVSEEKYFIDETWLDETRVKVEHRIEESGPNQSTLIYAISAQGPQAKAFGEGVSADFPDVMEGLAKYLAATGSI